MRYIKMIKEKEQLLDKVIAVCGYEHEWTIKFAEMLDFVSDEQVGIDCARDLAEKIIKKVKNEREEN